MHMTDALSFLLVRAVADRDDLDAGMPAVDDLIIAMGEQVANLVDHVANAQEQRSPDVERIAMRVGSLALAVLRRQNKRVLLTLLNEDYYTKHGHDYPGNFDPSRIMTSFWLQSMFDPDLTMIADEIRSSRRTDERKAPEATRSGDDGRTDEKTPESS